MASQSQGIQQLLAAEKKAAELVSAARKRKNKVVFIFPKYCTVFLSKNLNYGSINTGSLLHILYSTISAYEEKLNLFCHMTRMKYEAMTSNLFHA